MRVELRYALRELGMGGLNSRDSASQNIKGRCDHDEREELNDGNLLSEFSESKSR